MAETAVVMELDLPSILLVLGLWRPVYDLIAHNLDVVGFWPDEVDKQASNNGRHARTKDNDRYLVLPRPLIERFKPWIKLDVLAEQLNAFWERGWDAVNHLLKRISNLFIRAIRGQCPRLWTDRKFILSSKTSTFNCLRYGFALSSEPRICADVCKYLRLAESQIVGLYEE